MLLVHVTSSSIQYPLCGYAVNPGRVKQDRVLQDQVRSCEIRMVSFLVPNASPGQHHLHHVLVHVFFVLSNVLTPSPVATISRILKIFCAITLQFHSMHLTSTEM